MIREIVKNDLDGLLRLYMQLHDNPMPEKTSGLLQIWDDIFQDKNHHVIVAEENGEIVSSCVCVIIPNLTHGQRPYALIENVITDEKLRKTAIKSCFLQVLRKKAHWIFTEGQDTTVKTKQHLFNGYSPAKEIFAM